MYFEPSKKTYYRFPSTNHSTDFYMNFYYPEKNTHSSEEDTSLEAQLVSYDQADGNTSHIL